MLSLVSPFWRWATLVPLAIAALGCRLRFLTRDGAAAAFIVGTIIIEAGGAQAGMIIAFFLLGSIATKIKQKDKEQAMPYPETEQEESRRQQNSNSRRHDSGAAAAAAAAADAQQQTPKVKHGRDWTQVVATGGIPALICLWRRFFPEWLSAPSAHTTFPVLPAWELSLLAFVGCCCGDTLASEIGMLSKQTPLILSKKVKVKRGVDGGMTALGTIASVVGGCLVGGFGGTLYTVYLGGLYGCVGSFFDSLMGTYMQSTHVGRQRQGVKSKVTPRTDAAGFVEDDSASTQLPLTPATWKWLNNLVNVLSSVAAAVLAVAVQYCRIHTGVDFVPVLAFGSVLLLITVMPNFKRMQCSICGILALGIWGSLLVGWSTVEMGCCTAMLALYFLWRWTD